jgi:hypothetical protein
MSALLALPREMRDEIYSYFIPDFPIHRHIRSTTWKDLEESDAGTCSEATASTRVHSEGRRDQGSSIFTGEEEQDEEDRDFKLGIQALLFLNKQVHAEYLDALGRSNPNVVLYVHMENTPERPHEFVFDQEEFHRLAYPRAVNRLIVLARWHAGEHWERASELDKSLQAKLPIIKDSANTPSSESDGEPAKPTDDPNASDPRNEFTDIFADTQPVPDAILDVNPDAIPNPFLVSVGQEPEVRSFYNAFDQYRGRHQFDMNPRRFPRLGRVGNVHTVRDPADLLDASQATDTLFGAVKLVLQTLPNVNELDVALDVGGATSEDLAVMHMTRPDKELNVKRFLEWKPAPEDCLERIGHVKKSLLAGSYKQWPSGVEEWRKGVVEAKQGIIVQRVESGGWMDVMEGPLISVEVRQLSLGTCNETD